MKAYSVLVSKPASSLNPVANDTIRLEAFTDSDDSDDILEGKNYNSICDLYLSPSPSHEIRDLDFMTWLPKENVWSMKWEAQTRIPPVNESCALIITISFATYWENAVLLWQNLTPLSTMFTADHYVNKKKILKTELKIGQTGIAVP